MNLYGETDWKLKWKRKNCTTGNNGFSVDFVLIALIIEYCAENFSHPYLSIKLHSYSSRHVAHLISNELIRESCKLEVFFYFSWSNRNRYDNSNSNITFRKFEIVEVTITIAQNWLELVLPNGQQNFRSRRTTLRSDGTGIRANALDLEWPGSGRIRQNSNSTWIPLEVGWNFHTYRYIVILALDS